MKELILIMSACVYITIQIIAIGFGIVGGSVDKDCRYTGRWAYVAHGYRPACIATAWMNGSDWKDIQ